MKSFFKSTNYQNLELIGFISFAIIIITQQVLRPNSINLNEQYKHFLGVLPNLLAGIAMSIAIFIYGDSFFNKLNIKPKIAMIFSVLLSLSGLTLWEYIQIIAHRPFDFEDIIATSIGCFISLVAIFFAIKHNENNNKIEP